MGPVAPGGPGGPGPDPKADRFARLITALNLAVAAVTSLAFVALFLRDDVADAVGAVIVALLILTPLLRVAWFVGRWARRGDRRFALVGLGVLCVVAAGALLA